MNMKIAVTCTEKTMTVTELVNTMLEYVFVSYWKSIKFNFEFQIRILQEAKLSCLYTERIGRPRDKEKPCCLYRVCEHAEQIFSHIRFPLPSSGRHFGSNRFLVAVVIVVVNRQHNPGQEPCSGPSGLGFSDICFRCVGVTWRRHAESSMSYISKK